jgi:hypothetical protein
MILGFDAEAARIQQGICVSKNTESSFSKAGPSAALDYYTGTGYVATISGHSFRFSIDVRFSDHPDYANFPEYAMQRCRGLSPDVLKALSIASEPGSLGLWFIWKWKDGVTSLAQATNTYIIVNVPPNVMPPATLSHESIHVLMCRYSQNTGDHALDKWSNAMKMDNIEAVKKVGTELTVSAYGLVGPSEDAAEFGMLHSYCKNVSPEKKMEELKTLCPNRMAFWWESVVSDAVAAYDDVEMKEPGGDWTFPFVNVVPDPGYANRRPSVFTVSQLKSGVTYSFRLKRNVAVTVTCTTEIREF